MVSKEIQRYWHFVDHKSVELLAQEHRLFKLLPVHVTDIFNLLAPEFYI
jgi:hypothetical protein